MLTKLIISLCLTTSLNADDSHLPSATSPTGSNILSSANTSSSFLENELLKISTTCLSPEDFELLYGNALRYHVARNMIHTLLEYSVQTIGFQEMRKTLNLPPPGPWQPHNRTEPSEHELGSATTIEEYYNLKEPRSKMRSLDSAFLFEHNVTTAIAYLDKRVPSIRTVFRRSFEELSAPNVLDKKAVDRMLEEFHATHTRIDKATSEMLGRYECWGDLL